MKDIHDVVYNMSRADIEQFLFILANSEIIHFYNKDNSICYDFDPEVPVCQNGPFIQINLKTDCDPN
jgi:hypothetical protein